MHQLHFAPDLILQRQAAVEVPFQRRIGGKQRINLLLCATQHHCPFDVLLKIIQHLLHQHGILCNQQRRNVPDYYSVEFVFQRLLKIVDFNLCEHRSANFFNVNLQQVAHTKQLRQGKLFVVDNKAPVHRSVSIVVVSTPFPQQTRFCRFNGSVDHACHAGCLEERRQTLLIDAHFFNNPLAALRRGLAVPYALKLPAIVVERISTNRGAAIIHYKSVYIGQPCIIRLQEQFHRLVATAIAGRGFPHWQIVVVEAFHLNLTIFLRRLSKVER